MTARPSGVVLKYVLPAVVMWNAPHCRAIRPFADEFVAAVDEPCLLGAVDLGALGNGVEFGLVVLAEIGGVGVWDRSPVAHPRDRSGRVEATRERDPHALADRERHENLGVRGGTAGRRVGHGRRRYRSSSDGAARYMPENAPSDTSATAPAMANSIIARPPERDRSGTAIRASSPAPARLIHGSRLTL